MSDNGKEPVQAFRKKIDSPPQIKADFKSSLILNPIAAKLFRAPESNVVSLFAIASNYGVKVCLHKIFIGNPKIDTQQENQNKWQEVLFPDRHKLSIQVIL
jgi:hypothetical protein